MSWINNRINDALLTEENHEMDNSFLRFNFLITSCHWKRLLENKFGMTLIGYAPDDKDYIKIVFEDENFEKHWVHFDKQIFDFLKSSEVVE